MKGVSSIIAIILILMIVVALAALAWTWFSTIFTGLTETAGGSITQQQESIAKNFVLENGDCAVPTGIQFTIRNTGTGTLTANRIVSYLNGVQFNYTSVSGSIAEGASKTYENTSIACAVGGKLKVTIETGMSQTVSLT